MQQWNNQEIRRIATIANMNPDYLKILIRYLRDHLLILVKL